MTWSQRLISFPAILTISALIRAGLIIYAEWHDARSVLKYTDVDYRVFSDATRYILRLDGGEANVAKGALGALIGFGDPYTRETYRYTPLLALLLAPNEWMHPAFGKVLFSAADLLAGVLIRRILLDTVLPITAHSPAQLKDSANPAPQNPITSSRSNDERQREITATLLSAIHLLNPLVFAISTRGSSESLLLLLVLLALRSTTRGYWTPAALWLGLATHWKIYPVIYGLSCISVISSSSGYTGLRGLVNGRSIRFGCVAAGTFFALGGACYVVWGEPFLREAYLYHIGRRDHRHNFAPQFYLAYLSSASAAGDDTGILSKVLRSPLAGFVPQLVSSLGAGLVFGGQKEHVPFVWFVQTACFVLFNKVCTSQYFLWYILFIPLLVPRLRAQGKVTLRKALILGLAWAGAQGLWLAKAYELEFLGKNVFFELWMRGLVYVVLNAWVLGEVINGYC